MKCFTHPSGWIVKGHWAATEPPLEGLVAVFPAELGKFAQRLEVASFSALRWLEGQSWWYPWYLNFPTQEASSSNTARWLYPNALDALWAMAPWSELRIEILVVKDVKMSHSMVKMVVFFFLDGMMLLDFLFHVSFRWWNLIIFDQILYFGLLKA